MSIGSRPFLSIILVTSNKIFPLLVKNISHSQEIEGRGDQKNNYVISYKGCIFLDVLEHLKLKQDF